jgi:hypothetical protein
MDPASASPADLQIAFKVMTSLINHDLSVDGRGRRTTLEFDADWDLFLKAAENAGIHRSKSRSGTESLAACSVRAFEAGTDSVDALAHERTPGRIIAREAALVAHGANR